MTFEAIDHEDRSRPEGKPCILVYGYTDDEMDAIAGYALAIGGLPCIPIEPGHVNTAIRDLVQEDPRKDLLASAPKEHVIVLNAVSNYELNSFVQQFGSLQLPRPLFATVTPTSIDWKFKRLIQDLKEERAMFEKMRAEGRI